MPLQVIPCGPMPSNLTRQIRAVLENAPDAVSLDELLTHLNEFVLECSTSENPAAMIAEFEEELQAIHHEVVDYSDLHQDGTFLTILFHVGPIIPSTSVLSWFDLVLRPALREPKLPSAPVNYAKELIIQALQKPQDQNIENYAEKLAGFRKRLFDLYLLDAFNEGSEGDVLEWAELEENEKEKRRCWKANLEDILLRYGQERPEDLFTEIHAHFAQPSARLQLFMLLNLLSSTPRYSNIAPVLAKHPLLESLVSSFFWDNSSTVCTTGLTFLTKSLPYIALYGREQLRTILPRLLAVLARVLCWRERYPVTSETDNDEPPDPQLEQELADLTNRTLRMRPDNPWKRLEMSFNTTMSLLPDCRPFFTVLFYLYPSNVLKFLRGPIAYLNTYTSESPWVETWEEALDEDEIRRKCENLLREHICHPLLIWRDALTELSSPEFWSKYDISRIVSEATMLDVRNLAAGLRERYGYTTVEVLDDEAEADDTSDHAQEVEQNEYIKSESGSTEVQSPKFISPLDLSSGKAVISLTDMINASNALKSNIDVEFIKPETQWMYTFPSRSPSPSKRRATSSGEAEAHGDNGHVAHAISGLQREVLLLRNELNFELWVQRENVKHIGKLYQDRILMKSAEAERQGLYNKLRKYRGQVINLENELREHKQQASSAKNKYADWNTELQKKLKELREEKKNWVSETTALRAAEKEAKALFDAQANLLAEAAEQVFQLQTQKKENQHKIDRLKDYERQIEQHIKIQRLWDQDYAKFNARADEVTALQIEVQRLKIRSESDEQTIQEIEEETRACRRQLQALEAQLALMRRQTGNAKPVAEQMIKTLVSEKSSLSDANQKLREENGELRDEIEELRVMVEVLKAQRAGKTGLV